MNRSWIVKTPPVAEPFTVAEMKVHLGIGAAETQWDAYIPRLITGARAHTEDRTNRGLITQTITLVMDAFPVQIVLPVAPVASVTHIKYVDTGGTIQTLAPSKYRTDLVGVPSKITPAYQETWPTTRTVISAVEVEFIVGYGAAGSSIPGPLLNAMELLVDHWFENRSAVGDVGGPVALSFEALVRHYIVRTVQMEDAAT